MTPQRAQELEAELRRLAKASADACNDSAARDDEFAESHYATKCQAYDHAADLVRDAAKGE